MPHELPSRRRFLRHLAASPLLPYLGLGRQREAPTSNVGPVPPDLISTARQAISVFDFEPLARRNLPPAHYGYLATGVEDDATLRANREGFRKIQLRLRRLVDVRRLDTSVELFGTRWETPIILAPVSSQKAFHPEGEVAVARAARTRRHLQILSTLTTSPIQQVTRARGGSLWFQLYPTSRWAITEALLEQAEQAGAPVVVLTVDLKGGGSRRDTQARFARRDIRRCQDCHSQEEGYPGFLRGKSMFEGLNIEGLEALTPDDLSWDFIGRLKKVTSMKVVIKGIVTREDARLCLQHGADGIIVSNHGGRSAESLRSTIESLPEISDALGGRIPLLIDGGFRRGSDIFKALALGADAICIGRPYGWGLAAFGQEGVETVLDLLRSELELIMKQAGTTSIGQITPAFVAR